jgi:hypothetical protein
VQEGRPESESTSRRSRAGRMRRPERPRRFDARWTTCESIDSSAGRRRAAGRCRSRSPPAGGRAVPAARCRAASPIALTGRAQRSEGSDFGRRRPARCCRWRRTEADRGDRDQLQPPPSRSSPARSLIEPIVSAHVDDPVLPLWPWRRHPTDSPTLPTLGPERPLATRGSASMTCGIHPAP